MAGLVHTLRTQWFYLLVAVVGPIAGVWFALPATRVTGDAFLDPPLGHYVEVQIDRVQPLPWTIKTDGELTGRYALGWIGDRALLIEAGLELPPAGDLRGEVHRLDDDPRRWVGDRPDLRGVVYYASIEPQEASERLLSSLIAWAATVAVGVSWVVRRRRRRRTHVAEPVVSRYSPLAVPAPRPEAEVASFMRRHGFLIVFAQIAVYVATVMVFTGLAVADLLGFDLFDHSLPRVIAEVAVATLIAAPVTGLPIIWWARRQLAALRTVARFGELIDPETTNATMWGNRSIIDLWHSFKASHTTIQIGVMIADTRAVYTLRVDGQPDWLAHGRLRLLVTREHRYAIVLAPNGKAYVAQRRGVDSRHLRRGGKLPPARVITS